MDKYVTSNSVCEMFHISKRTLNRWQEKTPWGIPFPAPIFGSDGGTMKRYLTQDIINWELQIEELKKVI